MLGVGQRIGVPNVCVLKSVIGRTYEQMGEKKMAVTMTF